MCIADFPKLITLKPFIVKTQMNVKDADPLRTQFIHVKTSKDGKPVGIIVKRRGRSKKVEEQNIVDEHVDEEIVVQHSDEVQEIIGECENEKFAKHF